MNAKEEWNLFHTSFLIPSSAVFTGWRYIEVNYAHHMILVDLHTCLFCLFLVVCWLDSLSFLFLSLSSSHSRFSASHSSLFFFCSSSLNNIASIYWIANKRKKKILLDHFHSFHSYPLEPKLVSFLHSAEPTVPRVSYAFHSTSGSLDHCFSFSRSSLSSFSSQAQARKQQAQKRAFFWCSLLLQQQFHQRLT